MIKFIVIGKMLKPEMIMDIAALLCGLRPDVKNSVCELA
jgi:hypothetical protein